MQADLPALINHGLNALRDTLQQDKHLTISNTSIAIIGPANADIENLAVSGPAKKGYWRIWENEEIDGLLRAWRRSRGEPEDGPAEGDKPEPTGEELQTQPGSENAPPTARTGEDVEMTE